MIRVYHHMLYEKVQEEIRHLEQKTQAQEEKYVLKMEEHAQQSEALIIVFLRNKSLTVSSQNVFAKFKEIQDDMNRARSSAAHISKYCSEETRAHDVNLCEVIDWYRKSKTGNMLKGHSISSST